jgi:hypothetical protein
MQRITDLSAPPVPGAFYLVPTVRYVWNNRDGDWPIVGPKHTDAEVLNFPWPHYHVDLRFIATELAIRLSRRHPAGVTGLTVLPLCRHPDGSRDAIAPHPDPVWRRRRCRRAIAPTPRDYYEFVRGRRALMPALEAAYQDATLISGPKGLVCPHRHAPLGSVAPNCNGHVVCPLHGLKWDLGTGRLVHVEKAEG